MNVAKMFFLGSVSSTPHAFPSQWLCRNIEASHMHNAVKMLTRQCGLSHRNCRLTNTFRESNSFLIVLDFESGRDEIGEVGFN